MKFDEIVFEPHPNWHGVQAKLFFPNGYGASIIKTDYSYGGKDGLYEIAILKGTINQCSIDHSTSLTSDVLGHLTESDVETILDAIQRL